MLKIYGTSMSRAARSLWAAEELGVPYEHVARPVAETRNPEHLKLNPNGHVPVIDDDGTVLWESMAINLYLAEKYGKSPMWPASVADHGRAYQWSLFAMTEVEPPLITMLRNRMAPAEQRDEAAGKNAAEAVKAPLAVLDAHLKGRDYMLGKDFTIADLNVASVMSFAMFVRLDLAPYPVAQAWLQKCLGRPANQKVRALK